MNYYDLKREATELTANASILFEATELLERANLSDGAISFLHPSLPIAQPKELKQALLLPAFAHTRDPKDPKASLFIESSNYLPRANKFLVTKSPSRWFIVALFSSSMANEGAVFQSKRCIPIINFQGRDAATQELIVSSAR